MQFDSFDLVAQAAKEQAALPPAPPPKPERSAWGAIGRGIAGGAAQLLGQAEQALTIRGMEERRAADDPIRIERDRSEQRRAEIAQQALDYERGLRPDAATATTAENVVYGLSRSLTKAIGATVAAGPVAGATVFGSSEAAGTFDDLRREGVDPTTAGRAAAVAGVAGGVGVVLPMMGSTLARTAALYVAGGPGGFMAQQAATRSILERADYGELAKKYDPLDPVGLSLSALIPLPFAGAGALRNIRTARAAKAADVPPASPVAPDAVQETAPSANTEVSADASTAGVKTQQDAFESGSGVYTVRDAISADGPQSESVRLVVRPDGTAVIIRDNGDLIDVTNMIRAGFSPERAIAQSIGDDTSGGNVARQTSTGIRADQAGGNAEVPPVQPGAPDAPMTSEAIDAAMVHNLTLARAQADAVPAPAGVAEMFRGPVTENPNFKAWFGESAVRNDDGSPLVVYHGTQGTFDEFRPSRKYGEAYFFSEDPNYASTIAAGEGGNVLPTYVSLRNPKVIKYEDYNIDAIDSAWTANHDGLIAIDDNGVRQVIIAFRPEQIKSAIGNSGRFDPNSGSLTDPVPEAPARPVAARESKFPPVTAYQNVTVGPALVEPKPILPGRQLFRETNVAGLTDIMRVEHEPQFMPLFVANSPDIAIGQAENKGVKITFRPDSLSGAEHLKPGSGGVPGQEFRTDIVAPRAVQAIEMATAEVRQLSSLMRNRLADFERTDLPEGMTRFERKVQETAPLVEPAPAKTLDANQPAPQVADARQALADLQDSGKPIEQFVGDRPDLAPDVKNLLIGLYEAGADGARADRLLADYARTVTAQRLRPTADVAADVVEAARAGKTVTAEPAAAAPAAAPTQETAAAQMTADRITTLETQSPDMVVRIEDDGRQVTLAEELQRIRQEAAEGSDVELGALDAELVKVAAECAISSGAV